MSERTPTIEYTDVNEVQASDIGCTVEVWSTYVTVTPDSPETEKISTDYVMGTLHAVGVNGQSGASFVNVGPMMVDRVSRIVVHHPEALPMATIESVSVSEVTDDAIELLQRIHDLLAHSATFAPVPSSERADW